MKVKLLAFAQARDQLGFDQQVLECAPHETPRSLLAKLDAKLDPAALRVAVDCEYHPWDSPIGEAREIALIPPVSGG